MKPARTEHSLYKSHSYDGNRLIRLYIRLGRLFGLLMGITAISFILEPAITGKPGPILPRLTVLLIFGFFTMILVLKGSPGEEEEE
ncbi:MAG: hypothetical protein PVJ01_02635 [Pseudomonadota bacterium]